MGSKAPDVAAIHALVTACEALGKEAAVCYQGAQANSRLGNGYAEVAEHLRVVDGHLLNARAALVLGADRAARRNANARQNGSACADRRDRRRPAWRAHQEQARGPLRARYGAPETTAASWGSGRGDAPQRDWRAEHHHVDPMPGLVRLCSDVPAANRRRLRRPAGADERGRRRNRDARSLETVRRLDYRPESRGILPPQPWRVHHRVAVEPVAPSAAVALSVAAEAGNPTARFALTAVTPTLG